MQINSRVIYCISVTVESIGSFLIEFAFYEGQIRNLAPMPSAKVWGNSVRAPNPKWLISDMLEIISSTVWPTILHNAQYMIFRVIGVKEFISDVVLFDLIKF